MSKCNFYFLLLAGFILSAPVQASSFPDYTETRHTNTYNPELKPASLSGSYQTAAICFLGIGDCDPNIGYKTGDDYNVDTEKQCLNEGFSKLNCNTVQQGYDICPYNPSYGKGCKCNSNLVTCPAGQVGVGDACDGKYFSCQCSPSLVSCPANKNGSGAYCGGKYEGCVCKPEFQYTSANCTYPRSLSGDYCDGKYTGCSCPSGVSAGAYGCAEHYSSPCSGVCKTAYSDNCRNRTAVSTPYGCAEYWSDCPSKCKTAYNDNCRNRTEVATPYGCQQYWGDCQSKCQIAVTYVLGVGDILYSDRTTSNLVISGKTPIAVVFDVSNRLAAALKESVGMFSYGATVQNNIAFCSNISECSADGKSNTKQLVDFDKATKNQYPAANYCYNYTTAGTNAGEWFLPSISQLMTLNSKAGIINNTLAKINGDLFQNGNHWSSNQYTPWQYYAWALKNGSLTQLYGTAEIKIRPIIYF